MPNLSKSADEFLAEISANVKQELLSSIAPIAQRIAEAVTELQNALQGGAAAAPGRRMGRPPKAAAGKKPGRRGRPAKGTSAPAKTVKSSGRSARGTMKNEIMRVLQGAGSALTLTELRDQLMKNAEFKGRNPNTVYTQVVQTLKRLDVERTPDKKYRLK